MKKVFIGFVLFLFFIPSIASATDWYVRPAGGDYNLEDGTSYENAWDGLKNVVWGVGGVQPEDNLYVCGLHLHNMISGGSIVSQADVNVISGTSEQARVTIRGDCPGDPGIVWSAYIPSYEPWEYENNSVWSMTLKGDTHRGNIFEDIGSPNYDSYTLLKRVDSIEECMTTPGSHYSVDYEGDSKIYVHTSDSVNPTGRIALNRWGYEFYIADNSGYITFKNLKLYAPHKYDYRGRPNVTHIRWENCTLHHGESRILTFGDGNHYMEVLDCDIGYASTPIYCISGTNNAPSYYTFARNTIHHCGWYEYHQSGDMHAFGLQGGTGGLVEDNYIYKCVDGIIFYTYPGEDAKNHIVRRNYLTDFNIGVDPDSGGISFGCPAKGALGNTSGNEVYENIVVGANRAFYYKWSEKIKIYNNVFYNAAEAFRFAGNNESGSRSELRNNIAYNISDYFISFMSGPDNYEIDSDYNLFYSDSGAEFYFRDSGGIIDHMTFEEWKALSKPGCTFDPNSLTLDPLFRDPDNEDFRLQSNSPAIDNGTDVGLTHDFEGTPIPQPPGGDPDIGAYEYQSGGAFCGDGNCDSGETCSSCPQDCKCPTDCTCTSPQICCNGVCVTPTCSQDPHCGTDLCKVYTCNNPGTCSASCSSQDITECTDNDDCCPSGCNEHNDNDCGGLGPIAWYHFDEDSGTIVSDSSGNGNEGTIYGATWVTGISGNALEFDGVDDYLDINDGSSSTEIDLNNREFTLTAWIKPTFEGLGMQSLFERTSNHFYFRITATSLSMQYNDGSWQSLSAAHGMTADNWYHVAAVGSDNGQFLYLNGNEIGNDTATGRPTSYAAVRCVGGRNDVSSTFNGTIDEVRIYNRTLTLGEILGHYNDMMEFTRADVDDDGDVDIFDLDFVAIHFGQTDSHQDWNATADVVENGEIDIYDVVFVASRFT